MEKFIIFSLNLILLTVPIYSGIPSYIRVCGRRDPKFNDCVKNSMEHLRGKLAEGMPEVHVPSIEPLALPGGLTLADTESFRAKTSDMKIYGVTGFDIRHINFDADNGSLDIEVTFRKLRLVGDYDIQTRILVPISARGPIEIETDEVAAKLNLKFKFVTKNRNSHIFFTSMTCKLTISDYISRYVPRAGDESALAEAITGLLNTNKREIITTIAGDLEKSVSSQVLGIANKITKRYSYDELLPDRE